MSKAATVFILDSSGSMVEKGYFHDSKTIVSKILKDKMFKKGANDNVGLLTVGTKETTNRVNEKHGEGYENITDYGLLIGTTEILFNASIAMLKYLETLQTDQIAGDIFDAIILAVQMIKEHCISKKTGKPKAFDKKIYIFTDAKSEIEFDFFDELIEQCDLYKIKIIICGFDFIEDTQNIRKLQLLLERKDESMGALFTSEDALRVSQGLSTKEFNPFNIFKGPLLLGDPEVYGDGALSIQVNVYARTNQLKVDTPQKFSKICTSIENVNNSESFGKVVSIKEYLPRGGGQAGPMEEDEISQFIKAYRYGSHLIPYTEEDKQATKIEYPKSFKILYFTDQANIKREHYMSTVLAVVPDPVNNFAKTQFEALMAAMHDMKAVAICRFNSRDTTNPKLYILKYNKKGHGYLIQIPFQQDIKNFTFEPTDFLRFEKINLKSKQSSQTNPTPKPVSNLKQHPLNRRLVDLEKANVVIDSFIDSMNLDDDEFLPKKTFNPAYQRMKDFISFRAMGNVGLPKVDEGMGISKVRGVDGDVEDGLLRMFDLKYVPVVEKKKRGKVGNTKRKVDDGEEQRIYDEVHQEEGGGEGQRISVGDEGGQSNPVYPDKKVFPGKMPEIKNMDGVVFRFNDMDQAEISKGNEEVDADISTDAAITVDPVSGDDEVTEDAVITVDPVSGDDEDPLDFLFG